MDQSSKSNLFPWITILAGMAGLALRVLLYSFRDSSGLLPQNHIAGILSMVLTALMLGVYLIILRKAGPAEDYLRLFPSSRITTVGCAAGAVGMGVSGFFSSASGPLAILLAVFGGLCACGLLLATHKRYWHQRPSYLFHCVAAVYMIIKTMAGCRMWGAEPQLQQYLFQLLASLFLLMAFYYRTELDVHTKHYRAYVFFSQAALLCCFLCLTGEDKLFYLSAGIWMASDCCVLPPSVPRA